MKKIVSGLVILLVAVSLFGQSNPIDTDRLPIGDAAKKFDYVKVGLGKILDTDRNANLNRDELIRALLEQRVVMIGETHTNLRHHELQLDVIRGLTEAGKPVVLALEFFTPAQDSVLQLWSDGRLSQDEFMRASGYFDTWGHNYRYYAPIFNYCRDHAIPMKGVNVPSEYPSKVNRVGLAGLSEEDRLALPDVHLSSEEHRFFFKSATQGMDATMPAFFENMYEAQSLWDTAMGEGAITCAKDYPDAIVVVLAGSGHVAYNLGIGRILADRSDLPFASVMPVDVSPETEEFAMVQMRRDGDAQAKQKTGTVRGKGFFKRIFRKKGKTVHPPVKSEAMAKDPAAASMTKKANPHMPDMSEGPYKVVIRSLGDYLCGEPEMQQEAYPSFGFSFRMAGDSLVISRVYPGTLAWDKGLRKGDVIRRIDGKIFTDATEMKIYLQTKNWDDAISFDLIRDGEDRTQAFTITRPE